MRSKVSYATERVALWFLFEHWAGRNLPLGKRPARVYECSRCGYWHLTSMPKMSWAD